MARAGRADRHLQALRDVVAVSSQTISTDPLPIEVLAAVRDLVGCDEVLWCNPDYAQLRVPFEQSSELGQVRMQGAVDQDPLVAVFFEITRSSETPKLIPHGVPSVTKTSDYLSVREWYATREYREIQAPGGKHRLVMSIPDGPARQLNLLCWRDDGRDFTEESRWDLLMLMPHLEAAYRRGERLRNSSDLTPRQLELLALVGEGWTNYQIARRLSIAEGTVRAHLVNIYTRLGVRSRTEAVTQVLMRAVPAPTVTLGARRKP